jgi:hypothetical protein
MANNTNNEGNESENSRAGSALNLIAGVWLIIAPFILHYSTPGVMWNSVILGIIVGVLEIVGLAAPSESWSRWLNIVAGLWLIVSAAIYSYSGSVALLWDNVIVGVLVIVFASWSLTAVQHQHQHRHHMPSGV